MSASFWLGPVVAIKRHAALAPLRWEGLRVPLQSSPELTAVGAKHWDGEGVSLFAEYLNLLHGDVVVRTAARSHRN